MQYITEMVMVASMGVVHSSGVSPGGGGGTGHGAIGCGNLEASVLGRLSAGRRRACTARRTERDGRTDAVATAMMKASERGDDDSEGPQPRSPAGKRAVQAAACRRWRSTSGAPGETYQTAGWFCGNLRGEGDGIDADISHQKMTASRLMRVESSNTDRPITKVDRWSKTACSDEEARLQPLQNVQWPTNAEAPLELAWDDIKRCFCRASVPGSRERNGSNERVGKDYACLSQPSFANTANIGEI
ncbi:hypothetical protein C8J57DRAFT_1608288 [Mycena rebaudengoi]|nr:hypothetical protein C8J57DRAFT_1608288 [Mycena rebaudengoi]